MTLALPANNPLCDFRDLPDYAAVKPEHIEPALDALIQDGGTDAGSGHRTRHRPHLGRRG